MGKPSGVSVQRPTQGALRRLNHTPWQRARVYQKHDNFAARNYAKIALW
ncbi:hypothetical protein H0A70_08195 [Alcaligenaceae bacterium]|nr:hypothetical protein [Alcaligenaceae bacterium]